MIHDVSIVYYLLESFCPMFIIIIIMNEDVVCGMWLCDS